MKPEGRQETVQLPEELLSQVAPCWAREITKSRSLSKMALRIFRKGGSPATAGNYAKDVLQFVKWLNLSPDEAIASAYDWPAIVNEYLDYYIVTKGNAKTSSRTSVAAIKKWLETNEILSSRDMAWQKVDMPKYIRSETDQIPTKKELRKALSGGNVRDRTMILMAASSGLRRGSLLSLRFRDIDMKGEVPVITPRPETTKGKVSFFTFMSPEAKEALTLYRREREMRGENVGPDSYVFTIDRPIGTPYKLGTWASARWIAVLQKAGLAEKGRKNYKMHFHVLRKFFKSWCSLSGMNSDVVEYLIGHRSSVPQKYFIGDAENIAPEIIQKLEAEYRKAIPALTVMSDAGEISKLEAKLDETKRDYEAKLRELREDKDSLTMALRDLSELKKDMEKMQKVVREKGLQLAEAKAKQAN